MSVGTPTIILIIMALVAVVALYYLHLSAEERTSRGGFIYTYGAFLPYILALFAIVFILKNMFFA